ncbi:MAG: porin, partial [Sulfurimonas sp.]|nr:porin [Sulfurimonas sp.]
DEPTLKTIETKVEDEAVESQTAKQITEIEEEKQDLSGVLANDDVDAQFKEIKNIREALLKNPRVPKWIKDSIRALNTLRDEYDIDIGFVYRGVAQSDLISNSAGGGANIDLIAMYKPNDTSSVGFKLNARHQLGEHSSSTFAGEIGSLYTTSPAYSDRDILVSEFWYQHKVEALSLRVGIVDPGSFIDNSFYKSSSNYFFSSSLSSTPYATVPNNGLGLSLKYVKRKYFLSGHISDANAKSGGSMDAFLKDDLSLYSAVEFGITPKNNRYYLTLWNRQREDKQDANGAIVSINQTLDEINKVFAKYAFSNEATAKQYFSFGWGRKKLLDKNDKVGLAYSASQSKFNDEIQNTIEMFYRYDYYYGIQISADIQVLDPIYGNEDIAILPGLRLRVIF